MNKDIILDLIANGKPQDILLWAESELAFDRHILKILRKGYKPSWREAAEYRGALVYAYRLLAKKGIGGL